MQIAMVGLGTVLLVASIPGQYGLAGEVAAAGSVGYALVPRWSESRSTSSTVVAR
jgi:hypothetical protein